MKIFLTLVFVLASFSLFAQNNTGISLFLKTSPEKQLNEIISESGDMYKLLGHHGPAVENEFLAYRVYFNFKMAVDIYSKSTANMELPKAQWYPTPKQQKKGWGADYYKVGNTVGVGGVRLWDGEKILNLDPVSERSAKVVKEATVSYIEMLSKDVPYKEGKVDVIMRLTVYSGLRKAKVELIAQSDEEIQFVTGLNYHEGLKTSWEDNYFLSWGIHPEDVAVDKVEVGGAILFNPDDFIERIDDGKQKLLISKPTKKIEYWITSANAKEAELNSFKRFKTYVKSELPKKFDIENCVSKYSPEISEETKSGHRFWFADKEFLDGRTLKLSAVKPSNATHEPHVHDMDEFFFVLEGTAKFYLGGESKIVGPYTSLYCPSNVPHGISNAGDTELKYLVIKKYPKN